VATKAKAGKRKNGRRCASKSRNWTFTLNYAITWSEDKWNFLVANVHTFLETSVAEGKLKYGIYGVEVGELGTEHLQGYFRAQEPSMFLNTDRRSLPTE